MRFRPFSEGVDVKARSYSRALERIICDFGADHAFGQVNMKLQEHYGIVVPTSAARTITEKHAKKISGKADLRIRNNPDADLVIGECDGSMLPIVETSLPENSDAPQDRRKTKKLFWKEARLSMAHAHGSNSLCFAGTMESVAVAGQQLLSCVEQAGAHKKTQVHCVGDGASWIANQVEEQFGSNGTYLIDFYHLCEYLSAAAKTCASNDEKGWLKQQKAALKLSDWSTVLSMLHSHIEEPDIPDKDAPVRACYRYINNRPKQLDYKGAQEKGLPIGSGEIESAHRYVLQARLKLAGAWWRIENAKNMINLRTCRANDLWNEYWKEAA